MLSISAASPSSPGCALSSLRNSRRRQPDRTRTHLLSSRCCCTFDAEEALTPQAVLIANAHCMDAMRGRTITRNKPLSNPFFHCEIIPERRRHEHKTCKHKTCRWCKLAHARASGCFQQVEFILPLRVASGSSLHHAAAGKRSGDRRAQARRRPSHPVGTHAAHQVGHDGFRTTHADRVEAKVGKQAVPSNHAGQWDQASYAARRPSVHSRTPQGSTQPAMGNCGRAVGGGGGIRQRRCPCISDAGTRTRAPQLAGLRLSAAQASG